MLIKGCASCRSIEVGLGVIVVTGSAEGLGSFEEPSEKDSQPLRFKDTIDRARFLGLLLANISLDAIFVVAWLGILVVGHEFFVWGQGRAPQSAHALEVVEWIFFAATFSVVLWYLSIDLLKIAKKIWMAR